MDKEKSSGNVLGNVFQMTPQQNAEYEPNHSIPSLHSDKSIAIAHGSITTRQHGPFKKTIGLELDRQSYESR